VIRVLIAGDIRLYREGLSLHLAKCDEIEIVASASNREEASRLAAQVVPDVVLLDMAMHESLASVHDLRAVIPELRVVALTVPELDQAVIACAEAGVAGFVLRDASLTDLVHSVVCAARDEAIVSPRTAGTLLRRVSVLAADRGAPPAHAELTARERHVAQLIAEGRSNKEIAAELHVEVATVKNHVHNILDKLHVHRRGEIAPRLSRKRADVPNRSDLDPVHREIIR